MTFEVREEPSMSMDEYAAVSIAFQVRRVLDVRVVDGGLAGFALSERTLEAPYAKDYDADGGGPASWAGRFDLAGWGFLAARTEGRLVGCAAVACGAPEVAVVQGRPGLAVLWDLRVAPGARGAGVGTALFRAAEAWAAARGCRWLQVETQNVNVPACRFYARQGCALGAIHRFAYPGLPHEVQLLWYRDLSPHAEFRPRPVPPG